MHSSTPVVPMSQAKRPVALSTRGLTKCFDRPAVDALDLTVYGGEFYALVGPNGAGKTTTLRMVAGLLRPDAGTIAIDGIDALRRSGRRQADHRLAVGRADDLRQAHAVRISRIRRRALAHRRRRCAEARARELIDWLGLAPHAHERCEGFSKRHAAESGARRRAGARSATDHSRRAADRPRCRLRPPGQERAARARRRRRHRHHDHAYSRSRRAHGRPHRHHRPWRA